MYEERQKMTITTKDNEEQAKWILFICDGTGECTI